MSTNGLNISLFIPDRSIDGFIVVTSPNWTGECIKVKRANISLLSQRDSIQTKSGIYFLFGYDETGGDIVYIGESEDVVKRIHQHINDDDKSWFEEVVLFTSSNNFLTKGHIRNLEFELINLLRKSIQYELKNSNGGTDSNLTENMKSDVLTFLGYIKLIMPLLGFDISEPVPRYAKDQNSTVSEQNYFCMKSGEYDAKGEYFEDKFTILKGSKIREKTTPSCGANILMYRERLRDQQIVSEDFVFQQDHTFKSPSMAAAIVFGGNQNGWTSWKNRYNQTLDEVFRKQIDNDS